MRKFVMAAAAFTLVLTVAGCGSTSPTTTSAGAASPGTSTTPAPAPGSAAPSVVDSGAGLAGFGATFDVWNATRHPDPDFDQYTAYGADPALPQINGHTGARYVTVSGSNGYVTSYQVNYPAHTAIATVLADILRKEFPADASYLWKKQVPGSCYQAEVKSAKLAAALTSEGLGDGTGQVFVEAKSLANGGVFDASDVSYVMVGTGMLTYPSAGQAPGC
jgi:hypothetical protein